ncbi:hypothetical protein BASA81_012518 [Batrachochytrium salamandrivorans]|nr:hypothetical protein BASA81_012518 [Batrachochytrium salamandrivorans]
MVKIADFGFSRHVGKSGCKTACGTPAYVAPEVISGKVYATECDVWSLGVIMFVLLCGYPPFYAKNRQELFRLVRAGRVVFDESYWGKISPEAKDLILKMLVVDVNDRYTAKQVLAHPWVRSASSEAEIDSKALKLFNAKRKLRAAFKATVAAGRIQDLVKQLHDSDGLTRLPGEAVGFSGKVVFDADGYETPYELPESIPPTGGVWITCADLKTRLRFASHFAPKSASPTKRKRAPAAKTRPVSPKSNGTSNVGNGSTYTKQVCQVEFPSVTVEVLHWQETLLGHAQAYFELEVEVNGTKRWLKALKPSELVTEQHEFQLYRQRGELGITLQHIPNNPAISRVVQVDPTLSGYLQGVRVGDLLLNSSTLTFLRMQRRRIDFSKQLVDFDLETTARCPASLQLSMVRDSVTSEFPELDLLEQSFQMNKNKRTVLGQCQLDLFNPQQQPLAHYLQVDSINWEVKRRAVLPNQVCLTRLQFTCSSNNNNRARMFINLVAQEQDGKFDLALTSFHSPTVDLRKFADGSLQLEAKLGKLQLDDLQPNSPFPVVFTPTQFKLDHSLFLRLYLELGPGEDVVLLNLLDLMVEK